MSLEPDLDVKSGQWFEIGNGSTACCILLAFIGSNFSQFLGVLVLKQFSFSSSDELVKTNENSKSKVIYYN